MFTFLYSVKRNMNVRVGTGGVMVGYEAVPVEDPWAALKMELGPSHLGTTKSALD